MKNKTTFSVILGMVLMMFAASSCTWAGKSGYDQVDTSTFGNTTGVLVSKHITDYDKKYGYEVMVYRDSKDSLRKYINVFIPKRTYDKIPDVSDSMKVFIEYVEDLEYGSRNDKSPSFWDKRFHLCTGFNVGNR